MAIRYIDNVTILADVGERVFLPSILIARNDNSSMQTVSVSWSPNIVNTSVEGEFIFEGTVNGYAHKVLCSVQVGRMEDNPASVFPEALDRFGMPKKDIQTADIPDIDDYQYFKAKIPRTMVEEYQLKQLREMLADKIILARDVNHMRNAIYNIEEYCHKLQDEIDALELRVTDLERRVDILERETVVDGRNLGRGAEVFSEKSNRVLEFRTLVGTGLAEVYEEGREVIINVAEQESGGEVGCGIDVEASSFKTCGTEFPATIADQMISFSKYFGLRMVKVRNTSDYDPSPHFWSMMMVMGVGRSTSNMTNSVRVLKSEDSLILEIMASQDSYSGIVINADGMSPYTRRESEINKVLVDMDAYSTDVEMN